jgi:hypothetical protein
MRGIAVSQRGKRVVLLALAAAFAAGCGMPPTRVEFVEKIASENRKIARSTRAFRAAILPLRNGQAANPAEVRKAYDDMVRTVKGVKSDMDFQLLPPSSSSAKGLLDAYKAYLDGQDEILQTLMLPIVQEVEMPTDADGQPTNDVRWGVISGLLAQVSAKENEKFSALTQAQSAYASEHNYQTYPLDQYIEQQKTGKQ